MQSTQYSETVLKPWPSSELDCYLGAPQQGPVLVQMETSHTYCLLSLMDGKIELNSFKLTLSNYNYTKHTCKQKLLGITSKFFFGECFILLSCKAVSIKTCLTPVIVMWNDRLYLQSCWDFPFLVVFKCKKIQRNS